jgi:pimeloyl-ACP methyl ester carboxylesterase
MERKSIISSDGEQLSYSTTGSGRPVILLHGITMWSDMWWSNGAVDSLSSSSRLIIPDMRGHGGSCRPHNPAQYGMNLVNDLTGILDHERVATVEVVGFSSGAELGLKLATTQPARVASLIIIGSGWTQLGDMPYYREFARWARETGKAMTPDPDYDALDAFVEGMPEVIGLPRAVLERMAIRCAGIVGGDDPHRPHLESLLSVIPEFSLEVLPGLPHETSWRDPSIPVQIKNFLMDGEG